MQKDCRTCEHSRHEGDFPCVRCRFVNGEPSKYEPAKHFRESTQMIRDRLIKLLSQKGFGVEGATIAADYLIANGVTVKKFDPVNKCGTCAYYEKIGERMSGYCLKNRYGSDVACDPKHPYPTVPRSKVKCRHYKEAE